MNNQPFNDLTYTRRELAGESYEIQKHASNGSAFANCKCIQEKHLLAIRTESAEGVTIATNPKEKEFYRWLSPLADKQLTNLLAVLDMNDEKKELEMWAELAEYYRLIRHEITNETFNIIASLPAVIHQINYDSPYAEPKEPTIEHVKNLPDAAIADVDFQTGEIHILVNSLLKATPDLEAVVIKHEIDESHCLLECANACHRKAVSLEEKGARHAIREILNE